MSSIESNSDAPLSQGELPGSPRSSGTLVVVMMAVLAALVWALSPAHPNLRSAPLRPQPPGCPRINRVFVPTNYTEVPAAPLASLTKEQRNRVLLRLNMEPCPCGCNLSLAACLIDHPQCAAAKEAARKIIMEERAATSK